MNHLTEALETVNKFETKYPTVAAQRRALAVHHNLPIRFMEAESVEFTVGNIIAKGGHDMLNDIHSEIQAAKPAWQRSYEADMADAEARREEKKKTAAVVS